MEYLAQVSGFVNSDGKITALPKKLKKRIYLLFYYASKFEQNKKYTEKEINEIINAQNDFVDPATIRRELFDFKFLNRDKFCKEYWLCETQPTLENLNIE